MAIRAWLARVLLHLNRKPHFPFNRTYYQISRPFVTVVYFLYLLRTETYDDLHRCIAENYGKYMERSNLRMRLIHTAARAYQLIATAHGRDFSLYLVSLKILRTLIMPPPVKML